MLKISQKSILRGTTIFLILLLWQLVSPTTAFFWTLFLIFAVFKFNPRIIGAGAIVLLVIIPIAISTENYKWIAEQLAVYVFYLLCISVTLQFLEPRSYDSDTTTLDDLK